MQKALFSDDIYAKDVFAKPFLKWAGGKTQLLEQIRAYFPPGLISREITRYVEPFLGGGAVFFYVVQHYPIKKSFLYDVNDELILAYKTVQKSVSELIKELEKMQDRFLRLSPTEQETEFYGIRQDFNTKRPKIDFDHYQTEWVERTAQIIFLNRTCFNGLFRVNPRGEFNVPFGRYKNPQICNAENLKRVSSVLQTAKIERANFTKAGKSVTPKTFVYFDPPYRPISATSSFTSYSKIAFGDEQQKCLADFYRKLDEVGAKLMLSNSDPKNETPDDHFFEELYEGFTIKRVQASRMINSVASKRGKINELLIMNYHLGMI